VEPPSVRAYVGLGANLGDAPRTLAAAVAALRALPGARLAGVSGLYQTRPVGPADQPDFHNAVVALDVPAGPDPETGARALLTALKAFERAFGRVDGPRWGARALDLDLVAFGDASVSFGRPGEPGWLTVPHPETARRLFVLAPLAELAPAWLPPGWPETVASAGERRRREEGRGAVRRVAVWIPEAGNWGAA
jgi:2-amino-4-hydroxy-6-hydroxymethyldihydropteridine diphosphokinase